MVSITKDYGSNADYQSDAAKKVTYRYDGVFNRKDTLNRFGWGTDTLRASKYDTRKLAIASHWEYSEKVLLTWKNETFDNTVISTNNSYVTYENLNSYDLYNYYFVFPKNDHVSMHCLDKNICKVRFLFANKNKDGKVTSWTVVKECNNNTPQAKIDIDIDKDMKVTDIEITFDHNPNGYVLTFTGTYDKAPETLP